MLDEQKENEESMSFVILSKRTEDEDSVPQSYKDSGNMSTELYENITQELKEIMPFELYLPVSDNLKVTDRCNVESISTFISILGFRVVCATCGRQVQHPEFTLARSKQVMVTRGVRFDHNGNFTGIFLCILHGFVPGKPISGYFMSSSLPMPVNFLPQKLQNVKLACQQW